MVNAGSVLGFRVAAGPRPHEVAYGDIYWVGFRGQYFRL